VKAIVVTDHAAGTAGMSLVQRPEPQATINDVIVQVHASGFVPTELTWPSTWTDRLRRERAPFWPASPQHRQGFEFRAATFSKWLMALDFWS
jgi:hypothetical protein